MDQNTSEKPQIVAGWVFGGLSFIPVIGVICGIIAIIIGIVKKRKGPAILGAAGILFTAAIFAASFYLINFLSNSGAFEDLNVKLTAQIINIDAGRISLYKQRTGALPKSLIDLGAASETNMFFEADPWNTKLLYTPQTDGKFELRSAGPDKIMNTADDIAQTF